MPYLHSHSPTTTGEARSGDGEEGQASAPADTRGAVWHPREERERDEGGAGAIP